MKAVLLSALLLTMPALALSYDKNCRVGQIVQIKGVVEVQRQGQSLTPAQGTAICRGDTFKTAAGAIAELKLRDGTKLTVGKDSQLVIRDYRIYRNKPNLALFDLLQGAFRGITGSITQRSHRFEVSTRVATIGIRGTDFWGGYGLSPDGALDVVMLEGHGVYVKSAQGMVELDKPGLGTTVKVEKLISKGVNGEDVTTEVAVAPTAAKSWGEDKLKRAVATITPD